MGELKKLESDKRQLAEPKYEAFDLSIRKSFFFFSKRGQALAQVAERSFGDSILGAIQNLIGCGPKQCAVDDPA